jgi:pilus assembly protein TadC
MGALAQLRSIRTNAHNEKQQKDNMRLRVKEAPMLFGLVAIATSAGLTPENALRAIAPYVPSSFRDDFVHMSKEMENGKRFADALKHWDSNNTLRPLAHILTESQESGTSSLAAIDALSRDGIGRIRRESDKALKKLPITMLFPLVLCILPAFIVLSIVPTLISGFTSIHW